MTETTRRLLACARAIASLKPGEIDRAELAALATEQFDKGATRTSHQDWTLPVLDSCVYPGDTLLHIAAAAHDPITAKALLAAKANVRAKNRLGAEPLHAAAMGVPGSPHWRPAGQAETIRVLIAGGADPNALNKLGVSPLHRAVRCRCSEAVKILLESGAEPAMPNRHGSTPLDLAKIPTGRGGSGSPAAKKEQAVILALLSGRT